MKDFKTVLDTIGALVYRRPDYVASLSEDTGIGRNKLAGFTKGEEPSKADVLTLKGFLFTAADELEESAKKLRELARSK